MFFKELKEWLQTCPNKKWTIEEIWWPDGQEVSEGEVTVRFKIQGDFSKDNGMEPFWTIFEKGEWRVMIGDSNE